MPHFQHFTKASPGNLISKPDLMGLIVLHSDKKGEGKTGAFQINMSALPKRLGEMDYLGYTAVTFGGNHLNKNKFLRNQELHHVP